jgi:Na+:H+ antiporter, NhaA family
MIGNPLKMSTSSSGTSRAGSVNLLAQLSGPVRRFLRTEPASAGLLVAATLLALAWANSPWGGSYEVLWSTEFSLRLGAAEIAVDLRHWVNDGLMVFFFFRWGWRSGASCRWGN